MADIFGKRRTSIDELRYKFDQGARANRFEVTMNCPNLGFAIDGVRCTSAVLPGRQIETTDWSEYGPTRKMPNQISMDGGEAAFTFLCDSSFADRFLIQAWQDTIYASDSGDKVGNSVNPQFSYYYDYVGEVNINVMNRSADDVLRYTLHEAYPVSYAAQELSMETTDDIMKFEVTMAFRTFTTDYISDTSMFNSIKNTLNKGSRALGAFNQALGVFGKSNKTLSKFQDRINNLNGTLNRVDNIFG
tara:strand:+ start:20977 stop:21714 length:738 start_codon:yes stop_codon:yes gene_type:complete